LLSTTQSGRSEREKTTPAGSSFYSLVFAVVVVFHDGPEKAVTSPA
jgi:hypothetical protein